MNVPPPPPAPEPVQPTEQELDLQRRQSELLGYNLEALRAQREDEAQMRGFLEEEFGAPWAEVMAGAAASQTRTARALSERYEKAARGELPVSPTLERSLSEGESEVRERMLRALGPGWETSEPGRRALSDYKQRGTELREQSARGEITRAEQLGFAQTPQMGREQFSTPPQLNDLYQMLYGERALKMRSNEMGYQGQLNYQNLMANASMARAQNQGSMMSGAMGAGGMLGSAALMAFV